MKNSLFTPAPRSVNFRRVLSVIVAAWFVQMVLSSHQQHQPYLVAAWVALLSASGLALAARHYGKRRLAHAAIALMVSALLSTGLHLCSV